MVKGPNSAEVSSIGDLCGREQLVAGRVKGAEDEIGVDILIGQCARSRALRTSVAVHRSPMPMWLGDLQPSSAG